MSASTRPDAPRRSRRRDQRRRDFVRRSAAPSARLGIAAKMMPSSRPSPSPADATLRRPAVTRDMIARLAQRLWELHGGNAVLNWLEAERMLQDLLLCPTGSHSAEVRLIHDHNAAKRDCAAQDTHH